MNEFIHWALRQNLFLRIVICISFTAVITGISGYFLHKYATLVIGTIAAAFFAALLLPARRKQTTEGKDDH